MTILHTLKERVKSIAFFGMEKAGPLFCRRQRRDLTAVTRILAVQGGGIGDLIMAMPALQALRLNFPRASFTLMTSPAARQILPHYPFTSNFDELIEFDFHRCQKRLDQKISLIRDLRRRRFDLVYWPSRGMGMREEGIISLLTGARNRLGFRIGPAGTYNTVTIEFDDSRSICRQNLALLEAAGLRRYPAAPEFVLPDGDQQKAREIVAARFGSDEASPLVTIHPGATWNALCKMWPGARYRELIEGLVHGVGARVLIVGSKDERLSQGKVLRELGERAVNVAGETSVSETAALIGISQLFIGNDSGPLHIAMALRTPAIGIFGATSERHIISDPSRCTVIRRHLPCSPCYLHQPRFRPLCATPRCLDEIPVTDVLTIALKLLRRNEDCVSV